MSIQPKSVKVGVVVSLIIVLGGLAWHLLRPEGEDGFKVRYGITPYQDSGLPIVPNRLGWYEEQGLTVEEVPVAWGEIVTALASGSIDVAIYNFNSFLPPYANAIEGPRKPVFYCPVFIFKGQAIMVHGDAGITPFKSEEHNGQEQRAEHLESVVLQLKGKRIGVTAGTELEQIVLESLKKANLDPSTDVTIVHASPEDSLAAFLSKDLDAFAAGLTERTEARRHGSVELLTTADVMLPVIDGLVTTEEFAKEHPEELDKLVESWFRTIRYMSEDVEGRSIHIRDYLKSAASTRYSPEEYAIAWSFDIFPTTAEDADRLFNDPNSAYFWRLSWDEVNKFLLEEKKIKQPVPHRAYLGKEVLQRLSK